MRLLRVSILFICAMFILGRSGVVAGGLKAPQDLIAEMDALRSEWALLQRELLLMNPSSEGLVKDKLLLSISQKEKDMDAIRKVLDIHAKPLIAAEKGAILPPHGSTDLLRHQRHAIVNYIASQDILHVFFITRSETFYRPIVCETGLALKISQFVEGLRNPDRFKNAQEFASLSHALYKDLLSSVDSLIENIDQITVIPEPWMLALPFEILIRNLPQAGVNSFGDLHYLLRDVGISQAFSIQSLQEMQSLQFEHKEMLAVFAHQESGKVNTGKRKDFDKEVAAISEVWGIPTKIHPGSELINSAGKYRSLHIAAPLSQNRPGKPPFSIQLSSPNSEKNIVPVSEIAQAQIACDLLLISGGFDSESLRGLQNGIRNVVLSTEAAHVKGLILGIWEVELTARIEIIKRVHLELARGVFKDQALRIAQLDYLENAPEDRKSPFYWAGFQSWNDVAPVHERGNFLWWILLIAGFVIVLALGKKL